MSKQRYVNLQKPLYTVESKRTHDLYDVKPSFKSACKMAKRIRKETGVVCVVMSIEP